jgi:hypothetical protein
MERIITIDNLTQDDILSNLCLYDIKNPNNIIHDKEDIKDHKSEVLKKGRCFCDNCFYNRTVLAEKILQLQQFIEEENQEY